MHRSSPFWCRTPRATCCSMLSICTRGTARDFKSLEAASERKNDLLLGNQTFIRLKYCIELRKLRRTVERHQAKQSRDKTIVLSYRPGKEESGPEKPLTSRQLRLRNAGMRIFSIWNTP